MEYIETGTKIWNVFWTTDNGHIYNGTYMTKRDAYYAMKDLIISMGEEVDWSEEDLDNYLNRLKLTYDDSKVAFGTTVCWAEKCPIMKVKEV
jgi:hypothetical protein